MQAQIKIALAMWNTDWTIKSDMQPNSRHQAISLTVKRFLALLSINGAWKHGSMRPLGKLPNSVSVRANNLQPGPFTRADQAREVS
jgi:hypothetical protein